MKAEKKRPMLIEVDFQLRLVFLLFAVVSMVCTVTNFIPFSAITILLFPFLPLWLTANRNMHPIIFSCLLLFSYFLFSTLLYAPSSLLSFDFYRRDGNVFISYLPILLYGPIALYLNLQQFISLFLYWTALIVLLCISVFSILDLVVHDGSCHHFLFHAHNAAGGFLASAAALSLGFCIHRRKIRYKGVFCVLFIGLVLTNSRGSLLGFCLAYVSVLLCKNKLNKYFVVLAVIASSLFMAYAYPLWLEMGKPVDMRSFQKEDLLQGVERAHTIYDRMFILWPRSLYLWLQSPILGTGFGSYNDLPYHLEGLPYLYVVNRPVKLFFSSAHAHHSYLHILGETGLFGLSLFIYFLNAVRKFLEKIDIPSLRDGMLLVFWTLIWSSFTEHRLTTPSQVLPFTILLGLFLANSHKLCVNKNLGLTS